MKKLPQKYLVLERYNGRTDWTIGFALDEFNSVEEAMRAINETVSEDPDHFTDLEFTIAAINNQIITVQINKTHEVVVRKE